MQIRRPRGQHRTRARYRILLVPKVRHGVGPEEIAQQTMGARFFEAVDLGDVELDGVKVSEEAR